MKKTCIIFIFSLSSVISFAQAGEWTWMHGDSVPGSTGSFGIQGSASPTNDPPALYEPCEWTDTSGNFWMYGGFHNDLWKYNPSTNQWTWVRGSNTTNDFGSYGMQGVASPSNRPPSFYYGSASWTDLNNNLWMFGGTMGSNPYSDLWKYDISTDEWTWMKGPGISNQPGNYGVQGVANATNNPGCRNEVAAAWTDAAGDLWLFGGGTLLTNHVYNDLWRFHIATNQWTWVKGANFINQQGSYGTQGVEAANNVPGARWIYSRWKDNNGNFWIYGGYGYDSTSANGILNDLWRYNPVTNNWTWMNGSAVIAAHTVSGGKCSLSSTNEPGARYESRTCWKDANGNLWMFGGFNIAPGRLNDLWMYCIAANQWRWVSNDTITNSSGLWGTKNVASPANKPIGRGGAVGWSDRNGNLYLFGGLGTGNGTYNDLWKYTIDTACAGTCASVVTPVALFQSNDSIICANDCVSFTDHSTNANSWQWSFQGGSPSSGTNQNPQVCYISSGIYNVTLVASNSAGSDTLTINNYITVIAAPPTPLVNDYPGIGNDTLVCTTDSSYISYQWYFDSTLVTGATDTFLVVTKSGNYNMKVTNASGCKTAVGTNVTVGLQNYMSAHVISFSPNPADKSIQLAVGSPQFVNHELQIIIYNILGEVVLRSPLLWRGDGGEADVSLLPSGIYFVQLIGEKERGIGRFVKE